MNSELKHTPWGPAQHIERVAEGIFRVSTAGHGGLYVSAARRMLMPAALRNIPTFCGRPEWFEEDQDWALVALSFPSEFPEAAVISAVKAAASATGYMAPAREWLAGPDGAGLRTRMSRWMADNASRFEVVCFGSVPVRHEALATRLQDEARARGEGRSGLWWGALRRVSDGAKAEALLTYAEGGAVVDLAAIPAERVLARPT